MIITVYILGQFSPLNLLGQNISEKLQFVRETMGL